MDDLLYARLLQEQFNRELEFKDLTKKEDHEHRSGTRVTRNNVQVSEIDDYDYRNDVSPVDPSLELSDPNPDILTLFLQFNKRFFWGRLSSIEVKWSPRMTSCAGICVYEGRGGLCSVRLSLPLLKLRPRKDLVETLLHEMIHAYLFITDNDRDHDGHGPNFKSHMHRINKATGANISIYHNFHDEVESYQQHWWRCDGPCQNRRPYFGYVKRSMNRAPSPRDFWWAEHQMTCGGKYTKIKEPESYRQKKKEKEGQQAKMVESKI
uniref:SprT-like domain-containing protein n=1 Tax=Biomphalaria glabrata TaxID=6526 RepID=A0A2C9KG14_BIOGL